MLALLWGLEKEKRSALVSGLELKEGQLGLRTEFVSG